MEPHYPVHSADDVDSHTLFLSQTSMSVTRTMVAVLRAAPTQWDPSSAAVEVDTYWPLMEERATVCL